MGNVSTRKAKGRGVQGKGKTTVKKMKKPGQFKTPTTRIKCGCRNVSSRPKYLGNHSYAPANPLCHLTPSASHATPAVIPSPCRARAPPLSVGRSSALADKRRIWNYIRSSGPIMVQGFEDWPPVGLTAASGLLCQELGVCHHLGHRSAPSEWDLDSTQTYLLTAHREPRFIQQG
jgi:hypothetical protein